MVLLVSKVRIKKTLAGTVRKVNYVYFYSRQIYECLAVKVLKYSNNIAAERQSFLQSNIKYVYKNFYITASVWSGPPCPESPAQPGQCSKHMLTCICYNRYAQKVPAQGTAAKSCKYLNYLACMPMAVRMLTAAATAFHGMGKTGVYFCLVSRQKSEQIL